MYPDAVMDAARSHARSPLPLSFTPQERQVIKKVFTNVNRRVFFVFGLPSNVVASLLSMYSRMRNPRGLRGLWVDQFLPFFLATQLSEIEDGNVEKFFRSKGIDSLDAFIAHSPECEGLYYEFLREIGNPDYAEKLADAPKVRRFLETWLDKYGHNSIARMGTLLLCCEQVSLLAAKTIEWTRPGAGYVELSTRYVDMESAGCYPIWDELEAGWGIDPDLIMHALDRDFARYRALSGEDFKGPFPSFLRKKHRSHFSENGKALNIGVIGETCDVLGNLLPAAACTSLGVCVSGESFPSILKHLLLDATPENHALFELIIKESENVGGSQFARHTKPTEWEKHHWRYHNTKRYRLLAGNQFPFQMLPRNGFSGRVEKVLGEALRLFSDHGAQYPDAFSEWLYSDWHASRGMFDKLPEAFELFVVNFQGLMSFRGWRDLQRMGYCTHVRTLLTPELGYVQYGKPALDDLNEVFTETHANDQKIYKDLQAHQVPAIIRQYPLTLGNRIGFSMGGSLRQLEFCNWQRTKPSVNHEVRMVFCGLEKLLRSSFPWWGQVSRADMTSAYVFARGSNIELFS